MCCNLFFHIYNGGKNKASVAVQAIRETLRRFGFTTVSGRACCLHYVLKYGLEHLDEEKLAEMLTFANAAASIVTTRKGALRVMPGVEEVESFIESRRNGR